MCWRSVTSGFAPYEWGATFNNPSALGIGLLPQDFPQGQIKYLDLDLSAMTSEFLPNVIPSAEAVPGYLGGGPA